WGWRMIDTQNWWDETAQQFKTPAANKSFDARCAGCHFTGFSLGGDANAGYQAHAVADRNGPLDYDGDGRADMIGIGCEECHGPGSEPWQLAGQGRAIVTPNLLTPEREFTLCNRCHSRPTGIGAGGTPTPVDASGHVMVAGTRRSDWLTNYVSAISDQLWNTTSGDGKHSKVNRQQGRDDIQNRHYRNQNYLVTCTDCHDAHGNTGLPHQLRTSLDGTQTGSGLCMTCHDSTFPAGASLAARMEAHYSSKGLPNVNMASAGNLQCVDCHMAKTGYSAAGTPGQT